MVVTAIERSAQAVLQRIRDAAARASRSVTSVRALAAVKGRSAEEVSAVVKAGVHDLGESYLSEALSRQNLALQAPPRWHYIGALQSNKTARVAAHFDWTQSVDRPKIARRLSEQRPAACGPLQICVQVNYDREPQKAGVEPEEAARLCAQCAALPGLQLRGLMAIPRPRHSREEQLRVFQELASLFSEVQRSLGLPQFDTLSMGMSDDFEAAIEAGSTMVRIGSAIFGPRPGGPVRAASSPL